MKSNLLPLLVLVALLAGGAGLAGGYLLGQQQASRGTPASLAEQPDVGAAKQAPAPLPVEAGSNSGSIATPAPQPPKAEAPATNTGPVQPKRAVEFPAEPGAVDEEEPLRASPGSSEPADPAEKRLRDMLEEMRKKLEEGGLQPGEIEDPFGGPKVPFTGSISGTVTDAAGVPVAGAQITGTFGEDIESGGGNRMMRISIARGDDSGDSGKPLATSGADGSFTIALEREVSENATLVVNLTGKAAGYAASKRVTARVQNGEHKQGVAIALRGAGSVTGRVVDSTGRGIAGVTVSLAGRGEMPDIGGESEIVLEMPGADGRFRGVSDGTGQFIISDVPEGRYRARLRGTGWRQVSGPTELDVKAGQQVAAPADYVMTATAALVARFADAAGATVGGSATVVFRDASGRSVRRMHGSLGADGTLTLNDPPLGTYDVEITVWGYKPLNTQAAIQEGLPTDLGLLTLTLDEKSGGTLILPGDEDE